MLAHNCHSKTSLYHSDFYEWLTTTAEQLQRGKFHELDIENLVEELATLGRSEKPAVLSNLEILLVHLLQWQYQPGFRSNSWAGTIREHRKRLLRLLEDSPSLKVYLQNIFASAYLDAREQAAIETGLPLTTFPERAAFEVDQVLSGSEIELPNDLGLEP
ncbi:hypothetical protein DO97_17900 [Neosynechococcus sphagnicola sy1]|uniref:DUF29 domain-containing protein n=2 Tax=Neosynechococcus TaxID=1501143 RepID=A0A098THI0_9CYAN|nr:hypothetical protein DO97_17900 [Neosynechococcus sphagnicola sy1]